MAEDAVNPQRKIDGRTPEEWLAHYRESGLYESEAQLALAIKLGDVDGDATPPDEDDAARVS